MKNLGYFQLKADPGTWSIHLAPGRASNIYEIVSTDGIASDAGQEVVIRDFLGGMQQLRVQKREGMEDVPLLQDGMDDSDGAVLPSKESLWGSLSSSIWGVGEKIKPRNRKVGNNSCVFLSDRSLVRAISPYHDDISFETSIYAR